MKVDLKDTTFIIPVRIDSVTRLENLDMCVDYLQKHFSTHIHILESSRYNNNYIRSLIRGRNIRHSFCEDKDPVFYKTRYLNALSSKVDTPYVALWDADVIVPQSQVVDAVLKLRDGICDVAYPYDGEFLDTSDIVRSYYWRFRDSRFLQRHKKKMKSLYTVEGLIGAVGGAVIMPTKKYIASGGDNESFYGWGLEDGERHYRWINLGYKIYRSTGCLFHLSHTRDINGYFRSEEHRRKAIHDMNDVVNFTREEMLQFIN